jgi:hypothetical protein
VLAGGLRRPKVFAVAARFHLQVVTHPEDATIAFRLVGPRVAVDAARRALRLGWARA